MSFKGIPQLIYIYIDKPRQFTELNIFFWNVSYYIPEGGFAVPFVFATFDAEDSSVVDEVRFDEPFIVLITTGLDPSWESDATERFESSFIGVTFLI